MQLLLKSLLLFSIFTFSNAAGPIARPQDTGVIPLTNVTLDSTDLSANTTDLSATNDGSFIIKIKQLVTDITEVYPKAYLVGVETRVSGYRQYNAVLCVFTNIARVQNKEMVVRLGRDGWGKPTFSNYDPAIGNKLLFRNALTLDVDFADRILRTKYPRATYKAFSLYWPKGGFQHLPDQPYWIFTMVQSIFWSKYLWVGVTDFRVEATDTLPSSIGKGAGGFLAMSS